MPSNSKGNICDSGSSNTGSQIETYVSRVIPIEDNRKSSATQPITKDKWLYVFTHAKSRDLCRNIMELKSMGEGEYKQVDWSYEKYWSRYPKRERKRFRKDKTHISKNGEGNIYLCISQIQLPYYRIVELVQNKNLLSRRCNTLTELLSRSKQVNLDLSSSNITLSIEKINSNAEKIYLTDHLENLEEANDKYHEAIAKCQQKASKVRNESDKVRLATLTRRAANAYAEQQEIDIGELPLKGNGRRKSNGSFKDGSVWNYLDKTKWKVAKLSDKKEVMWKRKEKIIESKKFNTILKDYMHDVEYDNLKKEALRISALVLFGATKSEFGQNYITSIVNRNTETYDWFYNHFLSESSDPWSSFRNADSGDFSVVLVNLGAALAKVYSSKYARWFTYHCVDSWTQMNADRDWDYAPYGVVNFKDYLGQRGFPSQLPKGKFYEKWDSKKEFVDASKLATEITTEIVSESSNTSSGLSVDKLKSDVDLRKAQSPIFIALTLINIVIVSKNMLRPDASSQDIASGVLDLSASGWEMFGLIGSLFADSTTVGAAVSGLGTMIVGFFAFAVGLTKMMDFWSKGRYGKAVGAGLIAIGGVALVIGGAMTAAAIGLAATVTTIVGGLLCLIGALIINYFTYDRYEDWFAHCPWGVESPFEVDAEEIREQTEEILHLIGRPEVSADRDSDHRVVLNIKLPMIFSDNTAVSIDIFKLIEETWDPIKEKAITKTIEKKRGPQIPASSREVTVSYDINEKIPEKTPRNKFIKAESIVKIKYIKEMHSKDWKMIDGYKTTNTVVKFV